MGPIGWWWTIGCGGDPTQACADGFARGEDGNCYPVATGDDDDDDDDDTSATGATGETAAHSGTGCGEVFPGPVVVTTAGVACPDDRRVTFSAETEGWTSQAMVYSVETTVATPWSEVHPLASVDHDPCGAWDVLEVTLQAQVYVGDWTPGQSTVFACADHQDDGLTYALAVWDPDGNLADCLAWGDDPDGIVAGTTAPGPNEAPFDLGACAVGVR